MARNVKVFEADIGGVVPRVLGPFLRAKGISGRAESRVAVQTREALRQALKDTVDLAYLDGSAPKSRTGRGRRGLQQGTRAFGRTFAGIRGHIIGPSYMKAHEEGATIYPRRARALAIPVLDGLKGDGETPRLPGPRSWQNVVNTFIYKSKRTGNAYVAYKNSNDELKLLYVLVDSAVLRKYSNFLANAWEKQKPDIIQAMGRAMLVEASRVNLLKLARISVRGGGFTQRRR